MSKKTASAAALLVALPLAACGSAESGDDAHLTVAVMPIVDTAPIHLALEQGWFEDEGIDVTLEMQTGGAASVPGVVAGDYDLAFGNIVSLLVARDQGLPLSLVMAASATSGDERDYTGVIVPEDSDITSAADLAGRRVSVNNLSNIGDTTIRGVVDADGGDSSTIDFVEVPFPDVEQMLAQGAIDAGWSNDPFLTASLDAGYRVVAWNYRDTHPDLLAAGYFATDQTIAERGDDVAAFVRAMEKANAYATEHPDEVRRITGEYTEIDDEMRAAMALPAFPESVDRDAVGALAELAHAHGTLAEPADLDVVIGGE